MVHLSLIQKNEIIESFYEFKTTKAQLAREYNTTERNIYNIVKSKVPKKRKQYDNSNRFILKEQQKVDILKIIELNPLASLKIIKDLSGVEASRSTINRFLKSKNINCYVALEKSKIRRPIMRFVN